MISSILSDPKSGSPPSSRQEKLSRGTDRYLFQLCQITLNAIVFFWNFLDDVGLLYIIWWCFHSFLEVQFKKVTLRNSCSSFSGLVMGFSVLKIPTVYETIERDFQECRVGATSIWCHNQVLYNTSFIVSDLPWKLLKF